MGFGTASCSRHPLGVLECIPADKEATVILGSDKCCEEEEHELSGWIMKAVMIWA